MTDQQHPSDARMPADAEPMAMAPEERTAGSAVSAHGETIGATGEAQGDAPLQKDPSEWVSGDDPMTPAQRSYLDTLAKQAGEELPADLTKAEASEHIERLKGAAGA